MADYDELFGQADPQAGTPSATTIRVSLTHKGGGDFSAPWTVGEVTGHDVEQVLSTALEILDHPKYDAVVQKLQAKAAPFRPAATAAKPAPAAGGQPQQAPAGSQEPFDGPPKTCQHGQMVKRSGFSRAKNQPWRGYFCPTPKGTPDQCSPVFV